MRIRLWSFAVVACLLLSACGGRGSMRATFEGLAASPPPGVARGTPSPATTEDPCREAPGCRVAPVHTGAFDAEEIPEASGAAVSRRDDGVLWLVDDRPGAAELFAVRADGRLITRFTVPGMAAVNAEALASGPCAAGDGEPCLFIADIGDNTRGRDHVRILRVREPDLRRGVPEPASPDVVALRYPDGSHDAEALLVDAAGVPYIVTKAPFDAVTGQTGPTRLYAAPGFRDGLLLDLGDVPLPEPDPPVVTLLYGNTVTGGDSTAGRVLLRTYDQMVEFVAPAPGADLATFPTWPHQRVTAPWQPQGEAVAYAADGCGYYSISEGVGDIWLVPCRTTGERATAEPAN